MSTEDNKPKQNSGKIEKKVKKIVKNETKQVIGNAEETKNKKEKKKNVVKKIWNIISRTLLIAIIILFLVTLIRSIVFNKTDVFGYRIYLIMSGSMEPEINVKDAVITKETDDLQKGDIIAFQTGNTVTVHRIANVITKENDNLYQTKGDNNNVEDANLVAQSQVRGKYVGKISGVGNIVMFLKQNIIFVLLAIGILIIVIFVRRLI